MVTPYLQGGLAFRLADLVAKNFSSSGRGYQHEHPGRMGPTFLKLWPRAPAQHSSGRSHDAILAYLELKGALKDIEGFFPGHGGAAGGGGGWQEQFHEGVGAARVLTRRPSTV